MGGVCRSLWSGSLEEALTANGLDLEYASRSQALAKVVAEHMGGPVASSRAAQEAWQAASKAVKAQRCGSVIVPIGQLAFGLSRHRALLFKTLCDELELPCRLLRGQLYTGQCGREMRTGQCGREMGVTLGTAEPAAICGDASTHVFIEQKTKAHVHLLQRGRGPGITAMRLWKPAAQAVCFCFCRQTSHGLISVV